MNIVDKLRQIESLQIITEVNPRHESQSQAKISIEQALNGKTRESVHGRFFVCEKQYSLDFKHGALRLSSLLNISASFLALVGKNDQIQNVDLKKLLFIDTETTGLAGGSGTYAFLIGVGYFKEDRFHLAQFFMNDLHEETAILNEVSTLASQHDLLVSYNGKSYDIPLLHSRNTVNRIKSQLTAVLHLDLLHAVRRMWKHLLPDCSLGSAEKCLLQVERDGDVPGYLIPQMYFDFLRDKDPLPLKPIFYHNQQDILSMVGLTTLAMQTFENPLAATKNRQDVVSLGKIFEEMSLYEQSIELMDGFLADTPAEKDRQELLIRTAFNYKKVRNWTRATKIWLECIGTQNFHPVPYIELAKYYEHKEKDHLKAKSLVDSALKELEILFSFNPQNAWQEYRQDLLYRQKRLIKKLQT
ncbi:MAG: ribonuclease H-like domain-containing protein [bacterium]